MTAPLPRTGEIVTWPVALRIRLRTVIIGVALLLAALTCFVLEIAFGPYTIAPADVLAVLAGGGDDLQRTTVLDWRMPRALVGLGVGVALGAAGAVAQTLARNPLASPDILGIAMGASAGAVALLVFAPGGLVIAGMTIGLTWAAILGGLAVALTIAVLAWQDGLDVMRVVLIGVGMNTLAAAVVSLILVKSTLFQAADAVGWLAGSLDGRGWADVGPLWGAVTIATILLAVVAYDFRILRLDEPMAVALGVRVRPTMLVSWAVVVVLTAAAVAAAGPIAFIALAAPQVARMVFDTPSPPVIGGALVGVVIVLGADLIARFVLAGVPVGILTTALGAPFLLMLLIRENRKATL